MMQRIKDGKPVIYTHVCSEERKGKVMTKDELHDFAVDVLMSGYNETNAKTVRYDKKTGFEADFCFINTGIRPNFSVGASGVKTVNVLVVVRDDADYDISDLDISWMVSEYESKGSIPRVTFARAICLNGQNAVCGGDFYFEYYSVSLLPDEGNKPLDGKMSNVKLAFKFMEAWNNFDESIIAPYLDKDFHYASDWVFDELPCRAEYLDYLKAKLESCKDDKDNIQLAIGRDHQNGDVAVLVSQGKNLSSWNLVADNGRIKSIRLKNYDKRFKIYDYEDELYMTHGDHNECVMPVEKLFKYHINDIIHNSNLWRTVETEITTDDMFEESTKVFSLMYGDGGVRMLSLIATSSKKKTNDFISMYPVAKGCPLEVRINKILEWDNQIEATVLCSIGDFAFAFFAVDYYCNKDKYKVGQVVSVDMAALGMNVEEAQRGFQFEGQQAIDWLAKMGEKPTYDSDGNVEPVKFSLENLVAFINKYARCPDEAEFQSPVSEIETSSVLGVDFFKTNIIISRGNEDDELEIKLPLYFRKDFFPNIKEGDPIRGWLWVIGSLTGEH